MKTPQFRAVKLLSSLFIIATVICNLWYLGIVIWKYQVLELERILMFDTQYIIRSFSMNLLYMNFITVFLFGYAFNIASIFLLQLSTWVSLITIGGGIFSCFYSKLNSHSYIDTSLNSNLLSNSSALTKLVQRYSSQNFLRNTGLFMKEYDLVLKYFLIFEFTSLICLVAVTLCGIVARCITIYEEEVQTPAMRVEMTGSDAISSLRPTKTTVCLRA